MDERTSGLLPKEVRDHLQREMELGSRIAFADAAEIAVGLGALRALGSLADSYLARLGEALGESTADLLKKIRLRRSRHAADGIGSLELPTPEPTTIIISEQMTDEARLALIQLDPTGDGVRGKSLYWHPASMAWLPSEWPHVNLKQEHLAVVERRRGERSFEAVNAKFDLSFAHVLSSNYAAAFPLCEEAISLAVSLLGADHIVVQRMFTHYLDWKDRERQENS